MKIIIFFLLLFMAGVFFILELYRRYLGIKSGRPDDRRGDPLDRFQYLFAQVVLHKKIRKYPFFALFHGFIMWGFVILLFGSFSMALEGLFNLRIPSLSGNSGFLLVRDCFIFLAGIGATGSILRRIIKKPDWMHNSPRSYFILALILLVIGSESLFYAAQASLKITGQPIRSGTVPGLAGAWLISAMARLFVNWSPHLTVAWMDIFWWLHFLGIFLFLFIIPRSKHLHFLIAPFNTYWHTLEPKGALPVLRLAGDKEVYGAGRPEDFTWKQLLDAFSCVKCGRCHGSCPAFQSGELLRLKKLNGRLRTYLEEKIGYPQLIQKFLPLNFFRTKVQAEPTVKGGTKGNRKLVAGLLEESSLWSCTLCGACEEACPVSCEHMSKIIDLRRYVVSVEGNIDPEIRQVFKGIMNSGNPWRTERGPAAFHPWIQELGVPTLAEKPESEYLFFIGCTPTFEESARKGVLAFIKILKKAGVDFAILGEEEWCCGETARRLGNEFLFQETAIQNIENWSKYGFKKIITTCPHCFNTLKNEYPQFGGAYQVISHPAFLAELLQNGQLKPVNVLNKPVAYHDSCYLGRFNDVYSEPRAVLQAIAGDRLREFPRSAENSFCCGAGGGQFWLKAKPENPISQNRAREALATGADIVATACPYCRNVLQEGIRRESIKEMKVMDIAEILESSL